MNIGMLLMQVVHPEAAMVHVLWTNVLIVVGVVSHRMQFIQIIGYAIKVNGTNAILLVKVRDWANGIVLGETGLKRRSQFALTEQMITGILAISIVRPEASMAHVPWMNVLHVQVPAIYPIQFLFLKARLQDIGFVMRGSGISVIQRVKV